MAISLPIVSKFDDKGVNDAQLKIGAFQGIALGAFAKIGAASVTAFAEMAAGAVKFGINSVKAAAEAEAVTRQLENAAKNSGAFGQTADSIKLATDALDKHSTKLAEMSGIDDETINKLKSRWMAVPGIVALGTDGINNLATVSADVAAATGKDIESIGLMFAKMSGDSETALAKLTRAGVVLTDEQKNVYQSLVDSNKEAEAQAYLIEQLGKKYAGSARAMANPMDRLKVIFENFQETVGKAFLPLIEKFVPKVAEFLSILVANPAFQAFLDGLVLVFTELWNAIAPLLPDVMKLIQELLPPLMEIIKALAPVVGALVKMFIPFALVAAELAKTLLPPLIGIIKEMVDYLVKNPDFMKDATKSMEVFRAMIEPVRWTLEKIKEFMEWVNKNAADTQKRVAEAVAAGKTQTDFNRLPQWMQQGGTLNIGSNYGYPGQAAGGITTQSGMSWVGENGPELLNLPRGAQVIPLDRMGGGGITINVQAGMGTDGAALGEQIVNAIRRYERTSGAVFARA